MKECVFYYGSKAVRRRHKTSARSNPSPITSVIFNENRHEYDWEKLIEIKEVRSSLIRNNIRISGLNADEEFLLKAGTLFTSFDDVTADFIKNNKNVPFDMHKIIMSSRLFLSQRFIAELMGIDKYVAARMSDYGISYGHHSEMLYFAAVEYCNDRQINPGDYMFGFDVFEYVMTGIGFDPKYCRTISDKITGSMLFQNFVDSIIRKLNEASAISLHSSQSPSLCEIMEKMRRDMHHSDEIEVVELPLYVRENIVRENIRCEELYWIANNPSICAYPRFVRNFRPDFRLLALINPYSLQIERATVIECMITFLHCRQVICDLAFVIYEFYE